MEYIYGTPLNLCFNDFTNTEKSNVLVKIGEIAAQINNIQIDSNHVYVTKRGLWEEFIADRLSDRFKPLINNVITQEESDKIVKNILDKKALNTLSFLHLDMRHVNMIYNSGHIFILDAENCEFGDPLFELAVIDVGGELFPSVVEGYKNLFSENLHLDSDLYDYYKMERQALVLHLFMNIVKNEEELTNLYLKRFAELKTKLLA